MLTPFADTGWFPAVVALTELQLAQNLAGVGLCEEAAGRLSAIDDARCLIEQASTLVRLGRVAEAIEVARARRLTPPRA